MKFYPADWQADHALRSVGLEARCLWLECMCIMHRAEPYGHLVVNGRPVTDAQLAILAGAPPDRVPALMAELATAGVSSRNRAGVVYSRRMTRDEKRSKDGETAKITGAKVPGSRRHQAFDKTIDKMTTYKVDGKVVEQPPSPQMPEARKEPTARTESKPQTSITNGRAPPGAVIDFEFAEFWRVYPRRDDKGHAVKAFKAARRKVEQETLVEAAKRYAASRRGEDPHFTPLASTWLNGERWADEPAPPDNRGGFTIGVG